MSAAVSAAQCWCWCCCCCLLWCGWLEERQEDEPDDEESEEMPAWGRWAKGFGWEEEEEEDDDDEEEDMVLSLALFLCVRVGSSGERVISLVMDVVFISWAVVLLLGGRSSSKRVWEL